MALTVTVEESPLQRIGVATAVTAICCAAVTVTAAVSVQPLASVTVKTYVPAMRLKTPVQLYGGVPPCALTVTVALSPPHSIVVAVADADNSGGSVTVTDAVPEHPFASVTVKFQLPPARLKTPVPLYGAVPPVAATVTADNPP